MKGARKFIGSFKFARPIALTLAFAVSGVAVAAPQLAVNQASYQLITSTRVGRTLYDYTYRVSITSQGSDALNVRATVSSARASTQVNKATVSFGDVPAGATITSIDTFTIRQDRTVPFDPTALSWTVQYDTPGTTPPVANAGADQTVYVGATVQLDGSKSTDPAGGTLTYSWSFSAKPPGSVAALSSATDVRPTFNADLEGTYRINLIVTSSKGATVSLPATITVVTLPIAVPPVANAGSNQTVKVADTVTLDGTKSTDINGYTLLFSWQFVAVPAGSASVLTGSKTPQPTFVPDAVGTYIVRLTVDDQHGQSASAQVSVTTQPRPQSPVARPGPSQTIALGATVTLDGTQSSNSDGFPITAYTWTLLTHPNGSTAALKNPGAAVATLIPDLPGDYVVQLVVTSNALTSAPATVLISTYDVPPVANAGDNQTVAISDTVKLHGSGTDQANRGLTYTWSFVAVPAGSIATLQTPQQPDASFVPDKAGLYTVQLVVNDGIVNSAPATVNITVTPANNADIGVSESINTLTPTAGVSFAIGVNVTNAGPADATGVAVSDLLPAGLALSTVATSQGTYAPTTGIWTVGSLPKNTTVAMTLTVTAGTSGTYVNTVTKLASQPQDPQANNDSVTLSIKVAQPNPVPSLISIAPNPLIANGQSQDITLSGGNFISASQVYFGAILLTSSLTSSTSLNATVPGSLLKNSGSVPVTVFNPTPGGGTSAAVQLQIVGTNPTISGFSPTSGPIGSLVTITGTNFSALNPGSNVVSFNGAAAVVQNVTSTQLVAVVPVRATTGPISITTQAGSASSTQPFTVQAVQDFDIALSPASIQVPLGSRGLTSVSLVSKGQGSYQLPVTLSITGLPTGLSAQLDATTLSIAQPVLVTITATATVPAGSYPTTITATGPVDARTLSRTKSLTVVVPGPGATTVTGRVLHAEDDSPFVHVQAMLGSQNVFTDATGTYQFPNPSVQGDQVVRLDAGVNNTATANYPSAIALPVMVVAGQDNRVMTSYIQAVDPQKFSVINPGHEAFVTQPDLPNYELHIPPGATLTGLDGQPITKINVRTVPVDKLPIRPLPDGVYTRTVYLYYFFRAGGATPSVPIPVTMANDIDAEPGEQVTLYYYDESLTPDPNSNQWRIMGTGTVSQDGKTVVSDPGVGIPKFCCGASFPTRTNNANPPPPPPPTCPMDGNPVSLPTGAATVFGSRKFNLPGTRMPVSLSCGYNALNPLIGFFGRGTFFSYDWRASLTGAQAMTVIAPNGTRFILSLDADNVYRATTGNPAGFGWQGTANAGAITLRRRDGMVYQFANGLLTSQQDTSGNRITIARDEFNYPLSLTDAAGRTYTFDQAQITIGLAIWTVATAIHDPAGRTLQFSYDSQARLTSITDAAGQTESYIYSAESQITQKTDVRGNVTTYAYDANGRTVQEVLPDGSTFNFAYTVVGGNVVETQVTNPNGNVTRYRFNGQRVVARTIDALGRQTSQEIDYATNLVMATIDPLQRVMRYTYDSLGNRTSIVDPAGNTTLIEYDQRWSKPTRITDALGFVRSFSYDDAGHLISFVNATGQASSIAYTSLGDLASVTDPLGHVISFQYDPAGKLVTSTDAQGNSSRMIYDALDRVVKLTDPRGRSTSYTYDVLNRLIGTVDAVGNQVNVSYDASGNVLAVRDINGVSLASNTFDQLNRVVQSVDAFGKATTYGYDRAGNVLQIIDRNVQQTRYQYDALNRRTGIVYADGREITLAYDVAGNVSSVSDSESGDILYSYDQLNRVVSVTSNQGTVTSVYDALGRRIERTVNGNDVTTYAYDPAGRLIRLGNRGLNLLYAYDAGGRLISRSLPNSITETRQYDAASRVTNITFKTTTGTVLDAITYAYDASGNPITRDTTAPPAAETPFVATYNAGNRLTTFNGNTLSYDGNGNLLSIGRAAGTTTYTWDAENHLKSITGPFGSASFAYDAYGRRISRTINGQAVMILYDGWQEVAESAGSAVGTTYLTGLQVDELLARFDTLGTRALLTDLIGSVISEVKDDQSISSRYAYSPYGQPQTVGAGEAYAPRYTGREFEAEGLVNLRARFYDPQIKRFISEDPRGLSAGLNVYAYANGNPLKFKDPTGLSVVCNIVEHMNAPAGVVCTVVEDPADPGSAVGNAICNVAGGAALLSACGEPFSNLPGLGCYVGLTALVGKACDSLFPPYEPPDPNEQPPLSPYNGPYPPPDIPPLNMPPDDPNLCTPSNPTGAPPPPQPPTLRSA